MKSQTKLKTIILFTLLIFLTLAISYLGFSTLNNLSTEDTSALSIAKCIGKDPKDDRFCRENVASCEPSDGNQCQPNPAYLNMGSGTKNEFEGCSIVNNGSDCMTGLTCCACGSGGYKCGGRSKNCNDVCKMQGSVVTTPTTNSGASTPTCTSVKPAKAKLITPANRETLTENKVILTWENNGGFGKECSDNGKPDRYAIRYTVIDIGKSCTTVNRFKYKIAQAVEKIKGQKRYSIEMSNLEPEKKYCWFVRKRNGESNSFTDSDMKTFLTPASEVTTPASSETLKLVEGGTTLQIGVED